jgi:hypothetical protein
LYSSAVTWSSQVALLPSSSTSSMAKWVMKRLGAAPCPVVLAGLEEDGSRGRITSIAPLRRWHKAHALGDVNPRDGKVAWRAFSRTEQQALEAVGLRQQAARRRGVSIGPRERA